MPTLTPKTKAANPQSDMQRQANLDELQRDMVEAMADEKLLDSPMWADLRIRLKLERRKQAESLLLVHPQDHKAIAETQGAVKWIDAFLLAVESSKATIQIIRQRIAKQKGSV